MPRLLPALLLLALTAAASAQDGRLDWSYISSADNAAEGRIPYIVNGPGGDYYFASRTGTSYQYLSRLSSSGELVWEVRLPAAAGRTSGIAMGPDGQLYVGATGSGTGGDDYHVLRYEADGTLTWHHSFDGPSSGPNDPNQSSYPETDAARYVAADASGNVFVTGLSGFNPGVTWTIKVDAAGTLVWDRTYDGAGAQDDPRRVEADCSGNAYVLTEAQLNGAQGDYGDAHLLVYAPDGTPLRTGTVRLTREGTAAPASDYASGLAVDCAGNALVGGASDFVARDVDSGFVAYFAAGGTSPSPDWIAFPFTGGEFRRREVAVAFDGVGGVYAAGTTGGVGSDSQALEVARVTTDGDVEWARRADDGYRGAAQGGAMDIQADASGVYSVMYGPYDVWGHFVQKHEPDGTRAWTIPIEYESGSSYGIYNYKVTTLDSRGGLVFAGKTRLYRVTDAPEPPPVLAPGEWSDRFASALDGTVYAIGLDGDEVFVAGRLHDGGRREQRARSLFTTARQARGVRSAMGSTRSTRATA